MADLNRNEMVEDNVFKCPETVEWFQKELGRPTEVQKTAWPMIAGDMDVLVSAPTGTGKTLSAFLVFIDRLIDLHQKEELNEQLYLLYISPLKSLAADIRENLRRPLEGISKICKKEPEIEVGIRTGDTSQKDRQRMIKHPPHILITTPESLYLMLTSRSGQGILKSVRAVILDELHAMIDTKRGAHLMLSVARLEKLCGHRLQRIGLSATIEPLALAAEYLSPEGAKIAAPKMKKKIHIEVNGITPQTGRKRSPVWEELAREVWQQCLECRSVIAFTEGRRYAEKLSYYVNQIAGDGFSRVHHGSLSKEQRQEVEEALRAGRLRLLCATSSMELGIDVGEIDVVLQVGCPRSISGTMQRLGRAGHNPGRVSAMHMYPRTAPEGIYCGMTAEAVRQGGVEEARPPRMCLDVLAQHLVSMAAGDGYSVQDVQNILKRTYSFRDVEKEDITGCLSMLAGDYEHRREIPVRPRVLYDRIHEKVMGDAYSRMLAVAAGGTIPDKGMYAARTVDGVKVGELDEEFVYETRIGDRIILGSFGWKVVRQDRDSVIVEPASAEEARLPFWKGEMKGRSLKTSLSFGRMLRELEEAVREGRASEELKRLGLDETACENAEGFLKRQMEATGGLPNDRTIIIERFTDHTGSHQMMVHSWFGKRVNAPLSILMQYAAKQQAGMNAGCVDEEDGFLLYPYGNEVLPKGLLASVAPEQARAILEAALPATAIFSMTFRYNAARALMMGMKQGGRQPLWMQRLKSAEMLDSVSREKNHPLIRETRRECLEEYWDMEGVETVLRDIRSGRITVREVQVDIPSPMSLPLQWQVEAAEMYEYSPVTEGVRQAAYDELKYTAGLKPAEEELEKVHGFQKKPQDAMQLYSLLQMEGDLLAEELTAGGEGEEGIPYEWLMQLAEKGLAVYIEPGLWIAAEQQEEYEWAVNGGETEAACGIVRRLLYYRGPKTVPEIQERYLPAAGFVEKILELLCERKEIVEADGMYYHARLYDRARKATIRTMRLKARTCPACRYAALAADRMTLGVPPEEQLEYTLKQYCGRFFPASSWETVIFPRRVNGYQEQLLDKVLAKGEYFWRMKPGGGLCFLNYEDIDWEAGVLTAEDGPDGPGQAVCKELLKRGASFPKPLFRLLEEQFLLSDAQEVLLDLAEAGIIYGDSFFPVRQLLNRDKLKKASSRQRVNARVKAMSAGRWDLVRPVCGKSMEQILDRLFSEKKIVCRETFRQSVTERGDLGAGEDISWKRALELLGILEYTGQVRRGYFVAGLSGAQYIRKEEYEGIRKELELDSDAIVWLNAADPAMVWGRELANACDKTGNSFQKVPGTVVGLYGGRAAVVLERQGKVLRIFDEEVCKTEGVLQKIMENFVHAFQQKQILPAVKRLLVKEYPKEAQDALKAAGFQKEMMDYALYR